LASLSAFSNQVLDFAGQLTHRAAGRGVMPHIEKGGCR
jgi:hypothetical protein